MQHGGSQPPKQQVSSFALLTFQQFWRGFFRILAFGMGAKISRAEPVRIDMHRDETESALLCPQTPSRVVAAPDDSAVVSRCHMHSHDRMKNTFRDCGLVNLNSY